MTAARSATSSSRGRCFDVPATSSPRGRAAVVLLLLPLLMTTFVAMMAPCEAQYAWRPQGRFGKRGGYHQQQQQQQPEAAYSVDDGDAVYQKPSTSQLNDIIDRLLKSASSKHSVRNYLDLEERGKYTRRRTTTLDGQHGDSDVIHGPAVEVTSRQRRLAAGPDDVICKFNLHSRGYECISST